MKIEDFVNQLRIIIDQHITLVKSNSELLIINLDLMKECDRLRKENIKLKKEIEEFKK